MTDPARHEPVRDEPVLYEVVLAYFDEATLLSIRDPDQFRREAAALASRGDDFPDQIAAEYRHLSAPEVLRWFRAARGELADGYAGADPPPGCPGTGWTWGPRRRSPPG